MEGDGKDVVPSLILPGFWLEKVPVQAEGQLEWDFNMKGIFSLFSVSQSYWVLLNPPCSSLCLLQYKP